MYFDFLKEDKNRFCFIHLTFILTIMEQSKRQYTLFQKIKFTAAFTVGFIFLIGMTGEIILRIFAPQYGPSHRAMTDFFFSVKDERLGWKIEPGYSKDFDYMDKAGEMYEVSLRFDENSFKSFGEVNSISPKILFIGDSYTSSVEVSNDKTFYHLLKDSTDAEIFAIGAGGYGTLQEYMVLDKWVDYIRPDIVVWQVCSNDFIDNSPEMERLSGYKVGERRPYLDLDGDIFYDRPVSFGEDLEKVSYFAKWCRVKWKGVNGRITGEAQYSAEHYIAEQKLGYAPFKHSFEVTSNIVKKVKERLPANTKMLAFSADAYQPQMGFFKEIFEEYGIAFTEAPALYCRNFGWNGPTPFARDGYHWNEFGHAMVAWGLNPYLQEMLAEIERRPLSEN